MHYSIIILSNEITSHSNAHVINSKVKLVDDCTLVYNNETISFDYLIITNITLIEGHKEVGVLTESKIPVTNYDKQTSVENIYYCNNSDIDEIILNL